MFVVATAGHVDHGKSTLVRALTGMEPDRWAEERRRGLTIDLGFAWTQLPSGREVAFVDVPGHERLLGNMVAGLGPVPAVCFVVAADEGWREQSADHRDVLQALGIEHGLVVLTRTDRAGAPLQTVIDQVRAELRGTGLAEAKILPVCAPTGAGLPQLRTALDRLLDSLPHPQPEARVRLWIDRSFSISGAGTVVTGTLQAGQLASGDKLVLAGENGEHQVTVRAVHSRNREVDAVGATNRVALNLRSGLRAEQVHRGDVLLTPGAWDLVDTVDVRRTMGADLTTAPEEVQLHLGTVSLGCRLRPLDAGHARLILARALPLQLGDRLVLRTTGSRSVFAGAQVLDVDPPALQRRGAAARRAAQLAGMEPDGDAALEVARRGAVRRSALQRMGVRAVQAVPDGVLQQGQWWLHAPVFDAWQRRLRAAVQQLLQDDPLAPGLSRGAAENLLGEAGAQLLQQVIDAAGLQHRAGFITLPGHPADLGPAEPGIQAVERALAATPFAAPEARELQALGLGPRELAAAERTGRLLRLGEGIVLLPLAPAQAMRTLATLPQPFTTSQARQALDTTRRVAIPLLEYLDRRGWTRRLDSGHRTLA
ncbi:Selenocysteine-specific elongation factor [Glutamicibacter creatinolyticus]|uniref:Selenocysteine-specific elongation factor n=1 Tax=Glutamicibacter creatinolyticus TaxID=162496 RepID=A0A5B7WQ72_9MICC|nr:selenocysteine-specific translation elongation factor [Glutamicibacter creatinolyticus]QCY46208.1 Selenocysteine-specific elongation factor [Glutamicibacter creatinolyticus]